MYGDLSKTHRLHWGVQLQAHPRAITRGSHALVTGLGCRQGTAAVWRELQPRPRAPPGACLTHVPSTPSMHRRLYREPWLRLFPLSPQCFSTLRLLLCPSTACGSVKRPGPLGSETIPLSAQRPPGPCPVRFPGENGTVGSPCLLHCRVSEKALMVIFTLARCSNWATSTFSLHSNQRRLPHYEQKRRPAVNQRSSCHSSLGDSRPPTPCLLGEHSSSTQPARRMFTSKPRWRQETV